MNVPPLRTVLFDYGMRAIWLREHVPYETFEPEPGDLQPDAEFTRLEELEEILLDWL